MTTILSGAICGALMALTTITLSAISLFATTRNQIPYGQNRIFGIQIHKLMTSITILAVPVWILLGTLIALLYKIFFWNNFNSGFQSPQIIFFVFVLSLSALVSSVVIYSNIKFSKSLITLMVAICVIFGLLMPTIFQLGSK